MRNINQNEKGLYWGWYIVAAAFVCMGISHGSRYCFAIFVDPIASDLQWSRSTISMAATIAILSYSVGGILSGRLLDRMAPKWLITIGSAILGMSFILTSLVQTPFQFNFMYGIFSGLGGSFFGVVVCSAYISKWFVRKRGSAIGIATMGIGVFTMILPFVVGPFVKHYGWRMGFIILGILILVFGISMAHFAMGRTKPSDYGLLPDGDLADAEDDIRRNIRNSEEKDRYMENSSAVSYLRDSGFWILTFCFSIAVTAEMLAFVHQVAFAVDNGIERIMADASLSIVGFSSIAGRYFFGWISDKMRNAKYSACMGFAMMALGILLFFQFRTVYGLYGYALMFGFGYGSISTMMPYLLAERYGSAILGTIYGLLTFFVVSASSLGPLLGGYIYDQTGTYDLAWQINFLLLIAVTFIMATLNKKPQYAMTPGND
jgi:MFS family permease